MPKNKETDKMGIFLNPKSILIITGLLAIISFVFGLVVDIPRVGNSGVFIRLRDKYLGEWNWDPWFNVVTSILAFINAAMALYVAFRFIKINKKKKQSSILRMDLLITALFMAFSRLNEGLYILFDSDYSAVINGFGEMYIFLDILSIIILVHIGKHIFIQPDIDDSNKGNIFIKNISLYLNIVFFAGYGLVMLFAYDENSFGDAIVVAFAVYLIMLIMVLIIVVRILRISKNAPTYQSVLNSIAIILLFHIIAMVFLIGCGITSAEIPANQFPNRLFRFIRIVLLSVITYFYIPAFIRPTEQVKEEE